MKNVHLRNEQGVAMLTELVLVALVLAMVGIALYQSNHHAPNDVASQIKPAVVTAPSAADTTAKALEKSAEVETELSALAETTADQFGAVDNDVADLEGSFDENNF